MLPSEALKENLFPCIFQLLELHVLLGSWLFLHLQSQIRSIFKSLFPFHVTFCFLIVVCSSCLIVQSCPTLL